MKNPGFSGLFMLSSMFDAALRLLFSIAGCRASKTFLNFPEVQKALAKSDSEVYKLKLDKNLTPTSKFSTNLK